MRSYHLQESVEHQIELEKAETKREPKFGYDSFGNLRSSQGVGADAIGGDFRFQGQWLESATGLYNFRARDYDSRTGTFLSRDPGDLADQQVEAFNPYQFAYDNPYIYSDPSGMVTLTELVSGEKIKNVLNAIQRQSYGKAKKYALDELNESITGFIAKGLDQFLPFQLFDKPLVDAFGKGRVWDIFEYIVTDAICSIFGNPDWLWFGTRLAKNGKPIDNGKGCGVLEPDSNGNTKLPLVPAGGSDNSADFLFSKVEPENLNGGTKRSFLVGDFKLSVKTMYERYIEKGDKSGQWATFRAHSKNYQWAPVNSFITWNAGAQKANLEQKLARKSAQDGVIMIITSLKR